TEPYTPLISEAPPKREVEQARGLAGGVPVTLGNAEELRDCLTPANPRRAHRFIARSSRADLDAASRRGVSAARRKRGGSTRTRWAATSAGLDGVERRWSKELYSAVLFR